MRQQGGVRGLLGQPAPQDPFSLLFDPVPCTACTAGHLYRLGDARHQRMRKLDGSRPGVMEVHDWINANKGQFQGEVGVGWLKCGWAWGCAFRFGVLGDAFRRWFPHLCVSVRHGHLDLLR